jgi:hypothetical protein
MWENTPVVCKPYGCTRAAAGWSWLPIRCTFYDNLLKANPFPILIDVGQVLAAGQKVLPLADSGDQVIPGHDPAVMRLFPTYPCAADAVDVSAPPLQSTPLAGVKPGRLFPKAFPS